MAEEAKVETTTDVITEVVEKPASETVAVSKAEFDKMAAALKEANKEAAARRKRLDDLEAAEAKRKEDAMSESEKAAKRAAELEARLKAYERTDAQRKAAEKVGLPLNLAIRLMGETPEELEADAKALLETLPKPTKPTPGITPTNPASASTQETDAQKKARLYGDMPSFWGGK